MQKIAQLEAKLAKKDADVPRDHWLEEAINRHFQGHPLEAYRRLAFTMLDEDLAASPSNRVPHSPNR